MNPYKSSFGSVNPYSNIGLMEKFPPVSTMNTTSAVLTGVTVGTILAYAFYDPSASSRMQMDKLKQSLLIGGGIGALLASAGMTSLWAYQQG